jgi:hypothetical protein
MVAKTGLKRQDDGQPALQVSFMYRIPAVVLALLLSLYPCALREQTTDGSITGWVGDGPVEGDDCGREGRGSQHRHDFRY